MNTAHIIELIDAELAVLDAQRWALIDARALLAEPASPAVPEPKPATPTPPGHRPRRNPRPADRSTTSRRSPTQSGPR